LSFLAQVAAERGISPPETRSATKKSRCADGSEASGTDGDVVGVGVMLFSPPDQIANARRQEKERLEKQADRYVPMKKRSVVEVIK
jgi:hypothetical protein